jgi:hypothetical protein|tara:strand:- start:3 stop:308 length:306 start_codon:yes stop_codon:yes gene_type:complete
VVIVPKESNIDTIILGGGIELTGFKNIDSGMFIVLKKIVGSYARTFSDKHKNFEKLSLITDGKEMKAELKLKDKSFDAKAKTNNLFIALDCVLKELEKKAK